MESLINTSTKLLHLLLQLVSLNRRQVLLKGSVVEKKLRTIGVYDSEVILGEGGLDRVFKVNIQSKCCLKGIK